MTWLDEVWPKKSLKNGSDQRSIPEGVWAKCKKCGHILYADTFKAHHYVCDACGHHHRMGAMSRLQHLNQGADYQLIGEDVQSKDYLNFHDSKSYKQRLEEAKKKSGLTESIVCAATKIDQYEVVVAIFSFDFIGGSMGSALGERFVQAVHYAMEKGLPFICVTASGGARMQEGVAALFQMAKTSMALSHFKQTKNPYIAILTDPTSGGVAASMAMQADIIMAEKGALIGFTGPRVIAQTLKEDLPEGFQRAEFLLKQGAVDMVVERDKIPGKVANLLSMLTQKESKEEVV